MIQTGIDARVKIQDIVSSQLPNFVLDESPKVVDFLKTYYTSQEYQGGAVDIAENLDQYLELDNLTPEVVVDTTSLSVGIGTQEVGVVTVSSTKGFPSKYGLLKIDDEIITYTGLTTNTFTGLTRGFSGITSYHADLNQEELVFTTSNTGVHTAGSNIQNLSTLFLKEFFKKFKSTFAPGFEQLNFDKKLNVGNFLKEIKSFYETKGTDDAIEILFRVLYGVDPKIINLEELLIKPSSAEYLRREVVIVEVLSGNPLGLIGQTIKKIEKLNDPKTQASVSEVEPFFRDGKRYFKFSLFIGYDGTSLVEGNFKITPNTKNIEKVSVGSSTISVDSTIGFSTSGKIISGINTISYSDKSINQFFGCTGVTSEILPTSNFYSDEIYFGFEDGDINKKVEFRITGILSDFRQLSENVVVSEGDIIKIKNLGQNVKNPSNKTKKEVFANSWIYNTSASYVVDEISGSTVNLKTEVDRSSLKKGDFVELVNIDDPSIVIYPTPTSSSPYVLEDIAKGSKSVTLGNLVGINTALEYKLRKKLNKAASNFVPIDSDITSDISNIYFDKENGYAASNSLPSSVNSNLPNIKFRENINTKLNKLTLSSVENQDATTKLYSQIKVNETDLVKILRTGDAIFYESSGTELDGLKTGLYYIEIFDDSAQLIKLYSSRSFIDSETSLTFGEPVEGDTHSFTLFSQRSNLIKPRKLLKKFPLTPNLKNGGVSETIPGTTGILINGVEIFNYKTNDKVFFGPLSQVNIISSGTGYDVINPPQIGVSTGSGSDAVIQPVIKGSLVDAFVDPQELGIAKVVSIGITGGNGSGAVIAPVIGKRSRELQFVASGINTVTGIGISAVNNTITFASPHNLAPAERVIYNSQNGTGIGTNSLTLVSNESYFISSENSTTIKLHFTENDALSRINPIGLSERSGTQKLIVGNPQDTILDLKILNSGSNYSNRTLSISTVGISTLLNSITFENHGFEHGDNIVYSNQGSNIVGLDTNLQYKILKISDNEFGLANAGVGGTSSNNFNQNKFVSFTTSGIGTQTFKYPDIKASIEYIQVGGAKTTATTRGELEITPVVRGEIDDLLLINKGTGYGSEILNFEKKPNIKIKNGKNAEVKIFVDPSTTGIGTVSVAAAGTEYFSTPTLEVIDTSGLGNGARLKAVLGKTSTGELNGKIDNVVIIRSGIGYSADSTSVRVIPAGQNAVLTANVRSLSVNNNEKYGNRVNLLEENLQILQNVVGGYDILSFKDDGSNVSPIIGWAYDGNPIYGPYGFSDPEKKTNETKLLGSSYTLNVSNVIDRPSFPDGFFVEDYQYTGGGDLDEYNGRFEINDDYPNGVYAYHATVDVTGISSFPYFIGNKYRSKVESDNFILNQSFDFINSDLRRNTFPYKVSELNAGTDSLTETNEITTQLSEIQTVESGSVQSLQIINGGSNHRVGEEIKFDNTNTDGGGLIAKVSEIKGVGVNSITSDVLRYNDSVITKLDNKTLKITPSNNHNLVNKDRVIISGLTSSLTEVNGTHTIGVSSLTAVAISTISAGTATTEIYVSKLPENVSVGNSIGIGSETLKILNIYAGDRILTVQRSLPAIAHTASTPLYIIPDSFTIQKSTSDFNSRVNDKFFFNPTKTVGFGTVAGVTTSVTYGFGDQSRTNAIPQQGIYLENHPFRTNQKISYSTPTASSTNISISTSPTGAAFALPSEVFAVRKNTNVIGIKTGIGTDQNGNQFEEVFFRGTVGGDGNINSDLYFFESNFVQEKVNVSNVKTTVSLASSFHNLKDDDNITLSVKPNINAGIGTLTEVNVKRDTTTNKILIDPIEGLTTGIKLFNDATGSNEITIKNHNLVTGDKIIYYSSHYAVGLGNSSYYVSVIDNNTFKLCQTYQNAISNPPIEIDITAAAGITTVHRLSKVNPPLKPIKNNDLVFNLSDISLLNHKFKIYHDNKFENEFVSTSSTTGFNTPVGIVTVGMTNSRFTIGYGVSLPEKLYYNLEKDGVRLTADTEVQDYSEIQYVDSVFNGKYSISNVGVSSFTVDVDKIPEKTFYLSNECDLLEYNTNSGLATGTISNVNLIAGGFNYKKLPSFVGVGTTTEQDAIIIPRSTTIGNIKKTRIINEGFEYSSDKTLQPEALIPKFIELTGSSAISSVEIQDGGSGFIKSPNLLVIDTNLGQSVDGLLTANLNGTSINKVDVVSSPTGLSRGEVKLVTTNNSNGISIQKIDANAGVSTFVLSITKPAGGYPVNPFKIGDAAFIEGIKRVGTAGSGFNSSDYGFNFLPITNYDTSGIFDKITVDASEFTTNVGLAQTIQSSFAIITNSNVYPKFKLNFERSIFIVGEKLLVNNIERDLTVVENFQDSFIKVIGLFELQNNDIIVGKKSKNSGRIEKITNNQGDFIVSYSLVRDFGWETNTGKLNEDNQVIPNNDYYQNLSYSIQSPIEWNKLESPVNNLVHTVGTKNFADTGITSTTNVSIAVSDQTLISRDIIENLRVDTLFNFDQARDSFVGLQTNLSEDASDVDTTKSKFIQLKNTRLTDFTESSTNDVILIDDISSNFSNIDGEPITEIDVTQVNPVDSFNSILVMANNLDGNQISLSELIILNSNQNASLLNKLNLLKDYAIRPVSGNEETSIHLVDENFVNFELSTNQLPDGTQKTFLKFRPTEENIFKNDYDLKIIENKFNTSLTGIGTSSFGLIDISSSVVGVGTTSDIAGTTESIISGISTVNVDSLFVQSQIIDQITNQVEYVETLVTHNGSDTFKSQQIFDTSFGNLSFGLSTATISPDISGGVLSINVNNVSNNNLKVKSKIIGFGNTSLGTSSYRFLASGQAGGSERSAIVSSNFDTGVGVNTVATFDKESFTAFKSTVHVGTGTSEALHQVLLIQNENTSNIVQSQFLSVGNNTGSSAYDNAIGLGTFVSRFVGDNIVLEFHPDNTTDTTTIKSLNEAFYRQFDPLTLKGEKNEPNDINFGKITQSFKYKQYNAINGARINKLSFKLKNNGFPIFAQSFDPSDNGIVSFTTGTFSIPNHNFRNQEELIYTPKSTFIGVGSEAMIYQPGAGTTGVLPSTVFAVVNANDKNTFQISTSRTGSAVTFTEAGEGNAHQFEMSKSLTKAVISLDGIVQNPIARSNLTFSLSGNGGSIGVGQTIFRLNSIADLNITDLIKLDDEIVTVNNVGFGTTNIGPITGTGLIPLVQVDRASVGTQKATHTDTTSAILFKGSYNIKDNQIFFTDPPRGDIRKELNVSGLPPAKSDFNGRVYLRNDYSTNKVYDDISNQFTGIASVFTLKSGGINTTGAGQLARNGLLFINNIFQTPSTVNNPNKNYKIIDNGSTTTLEFSGITTITDGALIKNETDINQNELPRGGVIVSLGSTGGLGYAPLVPAKVKLLVGTGASVGMVTSVVGVAYSGPTNSISTASYNNNTGILQITTVDKHNLIVNGSDDQVILAGLAFTCTSGGVGIGSGLFPDGTIGNQFPVVSVSSTNTFKTQVGTSTIPHTYIGGGTVKVWYGDLTFGSGYNRVSVAATVFDPGYNHIFVSAEENSVYVDLWGQNAKTPTDATYNPVTGNLVLTIVGHGLTTGNLIGINTNSIVFSCSKDNYSTNHPYPRKTDPVSGILTSIISFDTDSITAFVGKNVGSGATITAEIGVGGALSFNIPHAGTGYKEPKLFTPSPSYDDMPIVGVSRVGTGATTDTGTGALITVDVNNSGVTGIGSTLFSVKNFELSRTGYGFKKGDKFTPVGLVTDVSLDKPISDFVIEVIETYTDNFSFWQFGELDYIDDIKDLQDGSRVNFPLFYNGDLISIEAKEGSDIILKNLLVIFVNGVLQQPDINYQFEGGTSISFTTAPSIEDNVSIYLYKGQDGVDTIVNTNIKPLIEVGDLVQLTKSDGISTSKQQDRRTVFDLSLKDKFETNLYSEQGIDSNNFRGIHLIKQKRDTRIEGRNISKVRDSIEPQIYPTGKIISDLTTTTSQIYVDNAKFFDIEGSASSDGFDAKIVSGAPLPLVGITTIDATVSAAGTVSGLTIVGGGSGYTSAPTISIGRPTGNGIGAGLTFVQSDGSIGVATTATATVTITNGVIDGFAITNPGLGYTIAPQVLVRPPVAITEGITSVTSVTGFSGIITGIAQKQISGTNALRFQLERTDAIANYTGLNVGDYIFIDDTTVGHGITSRNETGLSDVAIGSTFVDNIYQVQEISNVGIAGSIMCHAVMSAIDNSLDVSGDKLGTFSFGKISSLNRSSTPISIGVTGLTVDSGLSTFPTIQRSGGSYTLRQTGALPKVI